MKIKMGLVIFTCIIFSCERGKKGNATQLSKLALVGTWKLLTGTVIKKGDTTVTEYTKNISFIKIINDAHFAFLQHDLSKGKDSIPVFAAGGGSYSLNDSLYIEHLEYCSDRQWEGNNFKFTITIKEDTLIQRGIEKIESEGINRINIEKYVRVKVIEEKDK